METKRAHLTSEQLENMRSELIVRELTLQQDLVADSHAADVEEERGDEADQATLAVAHDVAIELRGRESHELQLIEEALRRIDTGQYGTCEDCGHEIAWKRLRAVPSAEYCLHCQERSEARGVRASMPESES